MTALRVHEISAQAATITPTLYGLKPRASQVTIAVIMARIAESLGLEASGYRSHPIRGIKRNISA